MSSPPNKQTSKDTKQTFQRSSTSPSATTLWEVHLHDLHLHCRVGVTGKERSVTTKLIADITLCADLSAAGQSDSLSDTIDYSAVAQKVREWADAKEYLLLEKLIEDTLENLKQEWPQLTAAHISVAKTDAVANARVGVCAHRTWP